MQFVGQKFHIFMLKLIFPITIFQNYASCLGGEHNSANKFLTNYIKHITFLPPIRPQKEPFVSPVLDFCPMYGTLQCSKNTSQCRASC